MIRRTSVVGVHFSGLPAIISRVLSATVVITTKNRKEDLRAAVRSALEQSAAPQVLVIDDGSTDGTADMLAAEFPLVQVDRSETSRGLIVQRNRAARIARGDIIFSIDDDAVFTTPRVIEQTLAEFDDPRVGAVAIPFINVKISDTVHQRAPEETGIFATATFIGTAHAIRRELFLKLNGYREYLFHQGEEGDFCIRMLDAGYVVRLGRADPIHHFESPRRDFRRMDVYAPRNDVLFAWYNVPFPDFPIYLAGTTVRHVQAGIRTHRIFRKLLGLFKGYCSILRQAPQRKPVKAGSYRLQRRLRTPMAIQQFQQRLQPLERPGD